MRYRTTNPLMRSMHSRQRSQSLTSDRPATYSGVVMKSALMLLIMLVIGAFSATTLIETGQVVGGWFALIGAPILGIISVIVTMRSTRYAPLFSVIYAVAQGLFLGAIAGIYTISFGDHIVSTALIATAGVFAAMLFLYRSGIIRVGNMFRRVMISVLFGLVLANLVFFILAMVGALNIYSGPMSGIYLLVVVIGVVAASLFLLIDFDNISKFVQADADKDYEWMLSLSLVITIVWLFVEMLRLLAILSQRR